jgi:hypothetical protein
LEILRRRNILPEPDVDGTACEQGKYFVVRKRSRTFAVDDTYNVAISAAAVTQFHSGSDANGSAL